MLMVDATWQVMILIDLDNVVAACITEFSYVIITFYFILFYFILFFGLFFI